MGGHHAPNRQNGSAGYSLKKVEQVKQFQWKDCVLYVEETHVLLENSSIKAELEIVNDGIILHSFQNRCTGFCWEKKAERCSMPKVLEEDPMIWITQVIQENLCAEKWRICCVKKRQSTQTEYIFEVFPASSFITGFIKRKGSCPDTYEFVEEIVANGIEQISEQKDSAAKADAVASISFPDTHMRWTAIGLVDQTDRHDTLAFEQTGLAYANETVLPKANILCMDALGRHESLLAICHAPVTPNQKKHFLLQGNCLKILNSGWIEQSNEEWCTEHWSLGAVCTQEKWSRLRTFYRLDWQAPWQKHGLLVSNTWGDRSQDSCVCENFVRKEIEIAAELGLDMVQIDDGWQKGTTVNSAEPQSGVWEGYYAADEDFWAVHPTRFPHGLTPLTQLAQQKNILLGLWFSPDSSNMFQNWERDAKVLLKLWKEQGITAFKLDGVKLRTPKARENYLRLLDRVSTESSGAIILQQDITAEQRLGYLCERKYGTLFVENRYTDFGNYYPYRTLRNLWMLSRYIPAQRMQFELLNRMRNPQRYRNDPLSPRNCTQDYLFATVLAAQPLFWMELQGLLPQDKQDLKEIIRVYRMYRDKLWNSDIVPIGQEPDGFSATGFLFRLHDSDREGYVLFVCEEDNSQVAVYPQLPLNARWELLAGQEPEWMLMEEESIRVKFGQKLSYAFYHWIIR